MKRLVAFLLLICVGSVRAETLGTLTSQARVLLRDAASTTRQRYSDAQIAALLNQGQREAIANSHCIVASLSFQLVSGTTYYPLPQNFESITRVTRGKYGSMLELSPAALDARSRGWENASGTPTYYFINFSSRGLVGFATWPATSSDTDTIKVEYYAQPTDMSATADVPFNSIAEMYNYHHMLAYFAAGILSQVEGLNSQSAAFMSVYTAMSGTMAKFCRDRPAYLPSASAVP